ncbi:hypothetical protein PRIPAC_77928 [Pristionchus pacificus]|uniref:G protein-coupled receptor n=1 Tax=Pristionchus pacificus TaxID=54126 RepID=A0A2A6CNF7_PRIPA|nr:hypothetical protein PRIPAC_77928 [Pristionchus pacificus]|eukprot:PDM79732.1 G protein-coupled receptor [Pristionchus pacificus]
MSRRRLILLHICRCNREFLPYFQHVMLEEDTIHVVVILTMDLLALLANGVFIFLIKYKTPKNLTAYSNILFIIACVDLFSALCSALCVPRVLTAAGQIVFVHVGPCILVGPKLCHLVFAGFAQCVGLSVLLLLIFVIYRLRILRTETRFDRAVVNEQLQRAATGAAVFAAAAMPLFYFSGSFDVPVI